MPKQTQRSAAIQVSWHAQSAAETLAALDTHQTDRSSIDDAKRLARLGPNQLPEREPTTLTQIAVHQFRSPLIYILALAAVLAASIGDLDEEAAVMKLAVPIALHILPQCAN